MALIFVNDKCVKEIGGAAVNDVLGSVVMDRPLALSGVPFYRLKISAGVVEEVPETSAEIAAKAEAAELEEVKRKALHAFFVIINEIRALKSQPALTRAQFLTWVRGL